MNDHYIAAVIFFAMILSFPVCTFLGQIYSILRDHARWSMEFKLIKWMVIILVTQSLILAFLTGYLLFRYIGVFNL